MKVRQNGLFTGSVIIAVDHGERNVERASSAGKLPRALCFLKSERCSASPFFRGPCSATTLLESQELSSHREFPNNPDVPLWNRGAENMHISDAQLTPINQIQDAPDISLIREEHIHHALVI